MKVKLTTYNQANEVVQIAPPHDDRPAPPGEMSGPGGSQGGPQLLETGP